MSRDRAGRARKGSAQALGSDAILAKLRGVPVASGAELALPSDVIDFPRRGRRLNAEEIAEEFYGNHVGAEWVHDNVAYRCRISARVVLWWEYDVRVHLEEERARALRGERPITRRERQRNRQPAQAA